MHVLRLDTEQAPAYRALMLEAYARHPEAFTSTPTERATLPLAWWEERLAGPSEYVVGAVDPAQQLVGVAGIRLEQRARTRHKAKLFGMYVRPDARGQGLGRRLVERALDELPGEVLMVLLTVSHDNAGARRLYERCGFSAFGTEPRAVRTDEGFVDKVHMWWERPASASD